MMQMLKLADKDFKAAICMTKGRGENVLVKNEKSYQVISNINISATQRQVLF